MMSYQREATSAATSRDREPFEVESSVQGDALLVQWQLPERVGYGLQVLAGLATRAQDNLRVECYAYSGLTVGSCDGADLTFTDQETGQAEPAVVTAAEEDRWHIGLLLKKQYGNGISLWHRLRFLHSEIDTETNLPFWSWMIPSCSAFGSMANLLATPSRGLSARFRKKRLGQKEHFVMILG